MKKLNNLYKALLVLFIVSACTDERELDFLDTIAPPSNISVSYDITQDNTGLVTITPTADGAVSFDVHFGDNTPNPESIAQGESVQHNYAEGTYEVKIVAYNLKGDKVEHTQQLIVSFQAPQNLVVVIENDAAISKQVNVTANADFATTFDFFPGDATNAPVTGNIGETITYQYQDPGTYTIVVEAKGGAISTTQHTEDFEVTEILAPITSAPAPPTRNDADVVSIFSDVYTNVTLDELPTTWSSSGFEATTVGSDNVWKLTSLDFLGMVTNYANGIDVASMEKLHIDYWVPDGTTNELFVKIVNTVDGGEDIESLGTTVGGSWQSIDLDMTGFDGGNLANKNKITQILIDSDGVAGVVYIDNMYFYRAPATTAPSVLPIDFEVPFELSSFDGGDISIVANPNTTGNSSTMVAQMVKNAGQPWAGSKITIPSPFNVSNTTVTMKVWSPRAGLNLLAKFEDATPWPNTTASAEVTATTLTGNAWEELTFDFSGISTSVDFTNLVLIMDNGTQGDGSSNYTIYVDDISTSPMLDFEPEYALSSFDGGAISVVTNPQTNGNTSSMVAEMVKNAGQPWAGSKITVPSPFSFTGGTTVKLKVWSPRAGLNLLLKFEDATPWPNTTASAEITATTLTGNAWEELTFDFSGISTSVDFTNLVLIMDNGTQGDGSSNYTIYVDDISQI